LSGKLYIVSTPIGNLGDISKRAVGILENVDFIACEDTRVTLKLLNKYDISSKLIIYNDFNENKVNSSIIELLNNNSKVALVSDAGTPCISDPGYRLTNSAHKNNIEVISIPGPCSVIAALSISGLPTNNYFFQGFLPKKKGRETKFKQLESLDCSIVIFESPKRITKTLNDINKYLGDRVISICKELTKIYEKVFIGNVNEIINNLETINLKGEFVIIVAKEGHKY